MRNSRGLLALFLGGACAVLVGVAPAHATAVSLSGELNNQGALVKYSTFRHHSSGHAAFPCTDAPGNYDGQTGFKLGPRDASGVQITNSPYWTASGQTRSFVVGDRASETVPTGNYAINGRMDASGVWPTNWAGTLNW